MIIFWENKTKLILMIVAIILCISFVYFGDKYSKNQIICKPTICNNLTTNVTVFVMPEGQKLINLYKPKEQIRILTFTKNNDKKCSISIYYPNETLFRTRIMNITSDKIYSYNFTAPNTTGIYTIVACGNFSQQFGIVK
jgi:hypothetical protein